VSLTNPAEILRAGLHDLEGITAEPQQVASLLAFLGLLQRWNKTYNLTAVKDPAEMVTRHLLDSLSVLPWLEGGQLLDAGSGGGLPGVPLALVRPNIQVTLLDSAGKKIRFLNHVRRELGLQNITPVQARLETFATSAEFDAIISRAFSDLTTFALAARHLAAEATRLLAMKGKFPESELEALPAWVRVHSIEKLAVPGLQQDRHLVIMSVNA
jgi:16S rRNA (guanine527-N7)-methyltransferase